MDAALLYLLKANVVLALFAVAYYGLLHRLTFFELNRAYLLLAVAFAAVYPALPVPALLPAAASSLLPAAGLAPGGSAPATAPGAPGLGTYLASGALTLYLAGAAALLLRLMLQLLSLAGVWRQSRPATVLGQAVRVVPGEGGPFSFSTTIYLTDKLLRDAEALPAALRHEQAHVHQRHTLDVLLLQVATALAWPNPAAWLLRRAALHNLEYLADRATLRTTNLSCRAYQYLLLRQQAGTVPAPALAFRVEFFSLKNRIAMLSRPLSAARQRGRYLLAAPLVLLLALGYAGARAQTPMPMPDKSTLLANVGYYLDGLPSTQEAVRALNPETIESIDVIKEPALLKSIFNSTASGIAVITTKANTGSPAVLALRARADLASGYFFTPAGVSAVVPKALAYITSHYPDARLSGEVMKLESKATGTVKYKVQLVNGKRPFYVYFTPQGDFLAD